MIKVEVIADSIGPNFARITTLVLTYPRFAHAELMTHRMFSRNASSSRAIPVKKQIQMVIDNPAIPLKFTKNQKGMQGGEEVEQSEQAVSLWLQGRDECVKIAQALADLEVHKQYANRVLEPWAHISVVVTSTEWDNFFALRYHPDALPEMQEIARQVYEARKASTPKSLAAGQWHMPFITAYDIMNGNDPSLYTLLKRSVAKCARVSYLNHDGTTATAEEDVKLYDRLASSAPLHASPLEHQAMAVHDPELRSGNFTGWVQYRKTVKGENVTTWEGPDDADLR